MSFASPLLLLVVLAAPAMWLLYRTHSRRARRFAVRYPAAGTLAAMAPPQSAWRRHLPAVLCTAAIAALGVALAKPQVSVSEPIDRASIVLVTDHSGSMNATDVEPTRMDAAKKAAGSFIDKLPARVRLGAVTYSDSVDVAQSPELDHDVTRRAIDAQSADGATATGDALDSAVKMLSSQARDTPAAIVLLSDGETTVGREPVDVARQSGSGRRIPIYTVALGTEGARLSTGDPFQPSIDVSPDFETLSEIASVSGGRAFSADDSSKLENVYKDLGSRLGKRESQRELTAAFAAAGLVLLLGAGLSAFRRPLRVV